MPSIQATWSSQRDGYAGSFTVFGHAGCYGDAGHCLPGDRETDDFDRRAPHPLTPWTKTVIGNDTLLRAIEDQGVTEIVVTVVPIVAQLDGVETPVQPLRFDAVRVLAYED
ncbi:MAG: hypothetical protein H0U79_02395 [Solirubrobacterales bacterium]|nr:hypothetical protein [Solirubrobacterales bacterium]